MNFVTNKEKGNVDTNIDYLFVVTDKLDIYLIPKEVIKNRSTLNLCDKYQKYKV